MDGDVELREREASWVALGIQVSGRDKEDSEEQFQRLAHQSVCSSQELRLQWTVDKFTPNAASWGDTSCHA